MPLTARVLKASHAIAGLTLASILFKRKLAPESQILIAQFRNVLQLDPDISFFSYFQLANNL